MVFNVDKSQNNESRCHRKEKESEELGNSYTRVTDKERVGAKSLDKHSSKTVPSDIAKRVLSLKFLLFVHKIDDNKAKDIPKRLIEESGMNVYHASSSKVINRIA